MRNHYFLYTMFVGMTFMLFSCNNPKSSSTSTNYGVGTYDSTALHVALVPNHDCLPIYYAKRMGIYDSLGLKLQIYTYASQMDCDTMLMSRYADGGWADKIRIAHYGKRMANLEVMWTGNQHWQLFSCGALRINHIKALSGRTIAIARTSAENVWLDQILKMGKLSADDVYRPQINNLKLRAQMLTGNQIDAAVLTWPYSSYALSEGHKCVTSQRFSDSNGCFVINKKHLTSGLRKSQLLLLEKGRKMAIDSLRAKGPRAYSIILQKDYGLPKQVADTIHF